MVMGPSSRRFVAGLIRIGLVVLAIVIAGAYVGHRTPKRHQMRLQTEVPPPEALGPGDMRIYNADSSVDLILQGDKILAGLSPKTIAKVRGDLQRSAEKDTSGLGGSIAQMVKKEVAGAIGTHAAFPVSNISDIRYEDEQIVVEWKDGGKYQLFGNTRVDGSKVSNTFSREDAERFVAAVKARMTEPAMPRAPEPPPAAPTTTPR
jgi:hypothetical protein